MIPNSSYYLNKLFLDEMIFVSYQKSISAPLLTNN